MSTPADSNGGGGGGSGTASGAATAAVPPPIAATSGTPPVAPIAVQTLPPLAVPTTSAAAPPAANVNVAAENEMLRARVVQLELTLRAIGDSRRQSGILPPPPEPDSFRSVLAAMPEDSILTTLPPSAASTPVNATAAATPAAADSALSHETAALIAHLRDENRRLSDENKRLTVELSTAAGVVDSRLSSLAPPGTIATTPAGGQNRSGTLTLPLTPLGGASSTANDRSNATLTLAAAVVSSHRRAASSSTNSSAASSPMASPAAGGATIVNSSGTTSGSTTPRDGKSGDGATSGASTPRDMRAATTGGAAKSIGKADGKELANKELLNSKDEKKADGSGGGISGKKDHTLTFTEDSPFYRRKLFEHEQRVTDLDGRLATLIHLTQRFCEKANKFAVASQALSVEMNKKWTRIERSWKEDGVVTLGSSFSQLSIMLETFQLITHKLSMSVDNLLGKSMRDFRATHIKAAQASADALRKATDEYETWLVKFLSQKNEISKAVKELKPEKRDALLHQQAEEDKQLRDRRLKFELLRFDHVAVLNDIGTQRRLELIEIVCASHFAFNVFFHEGGYMSDTVKQDLQHISTCVQQRRKSFKGEAAQQKTNRKDLETRLSNYPKEEPFRVGQLFPSAEQKAEKAKGGKATDKQGYLRKQSNNFAKDWKRRWFQLNDGQLFYFRSQKDLSPQHVVNVLICTVKLSIQHDLRFVFEVISPQQRTYTLQAEDAKDMKDWVSVFQNATESLLNHQTVGDSKADKKLSEKEMIKKMEHKSNVLAKLREINKVCCDCGEKDPEWVSINLGCSMCIDCSGIHRSLGVHISKVRSITLDTLEPSLLNMLAAIGNVKFNKLYEGELPASAKPDHARWNAQSPPLSKAARDEFIKDFIHQKYVHKKWLSESMTRRQAAGAALANGGGASPAAGTAVHAVPSGNGNAAGGPVVVLSAAEERALELHDAAYTEDIDSMLCLLAVATPTPVDVNWQNPADHLRTALHKCAESDSILCAELLIQNNAKPNVEDKEKNTPLKLAMAAGKHDMQERLEKLTAKK